MNENPDGPAEAGFEFYKTSKPLTRWWWFSGPIDQAAIEYQLDWVKSAGFGGVEIAWIYPLPGHEPGPRFLDVEWAAAAVHAKRYADRLGLVCDFTFGTLWPLGGSFVAEADAARVFGGLSPQRLADSWDAPFEDEPGFILDHLSRGALAHYAEKVGPALAGALAGSPSAIFCDSWEVETEGLWTAGFAKRFEAMFGYAIEPAMPRIHDHPDIRYDYRKLLAQLILDEFYRPYTKIAHNLGAVARVQCHGAPTDLLAAYAAVDIPESEAILFDPDFSLIPASAAALAGKGLVTAEAFTCLYGWEPRPGPAPHHKQEQIADLKLLADALFANGVNHLVWHGMPYNPPGGRNEFYATVHVGPDAPFAGELPAFNAYLEQLSRALKAGKTDARIAAYLPLEDAWMLDRLPVEQRKPSALYHWEMQTVHPPQELKGYRPLWISTPFLQQARLCDGEMLAGEARFKGLFIDVDWLDAAALVEILRLARQGLPVCLARPPRQPGHIPSPGYAGLLAELTSLENVGAEATRVFSVIPPLVSGPTLPDFWCKATGRDHLFFFAHPKAQRLHYPMRYGEAAMTGQVRVPVAIHLDAAAVDHELVFDPYQSILLRVTGAGQIETLDSHFLPSIPNLAQA